MPPKNPSAGLKSLLIWSLLLPLAAALQQQPDSHAAPHAYSPSPRRDELSKHAAAQAAPRWRETAGDSLTTARGGSNSINNNNDKRNNQDARTRSDSNERALATFLAPADRNPAVRAPAPWSSSSVGLASRQTARSLQDWQVEDLILLATVDGRIHARDRLTGAEKWQLETAKPMVQTVYHPRNKSRDTDPADPGDPLWIVEPSQDGSIYLYTPGSGFGIQKLGMTVKQLAERSPLASEGHPAVAYTAETTSTLYIIDAATGNILKTFSSAGAKKADDNQSCRKVNPLDPLEEEECEPRGTLTIGRNEYIIGVQDRDSGEQISTIRYSEWVPNKNDEDLRSQHVAAKDGKYVYTSHDGAILGLDLAHNDGHRLTSFEKPTFSYRLHSPVARVFDIVRREGDPARDASLVVLPQPVAPSPDDGTGAAEHRYENIFLDYSDDGSWYALSESNYPTVTWGARPAERNVFDVSETVPAPWSMLSQSERQEFVGVHQLSFPIRQTPGGHHLIDGNVPFGLDPPPEEYSGRTIEPPPSFVDKLPSFRYAMTLLALGLMACAVLYQQQQLGQAKKVARMQEAVPMTVQPEPLPQPEPVDEQPPMIREDEPAQETIFPQEPEQTLADAKDAVTEGGPAAEDDFEKIESHEAEELDDAPQVDEAKPTKKKATRGKRAGKKQKDKEQLRADARAKRANSQPTPATEIVTVAASESPQISGPLQINSLLIHTDKVIGQGSCGTSVFEGSFEGRDVAVKRMLSQYYELASQEVSFLQQSDDHPNVIRYFCQQKDDHFLYIAVELCQASLFEVWEAEKARSEARQTQLRSLKLTIQQDVPKALQQLAAGLYHLHNLRIIHRDIKPQNILVAFPKKNQNAGPRLVISDFGLGKNLPENVSTLVDPTGNAGTSGWKAPELISQPKDIEGRNSQNTSHTGGSEGPNGVMSGVKRAADIFSLGCLFFWVLTDGMHPYEDENGWQQLRELNIKRDNKKMAVLARWSDAYEPMQLITSMLEHQPENRPTAIQVLNHPFFWAAEKRLFFLCDVSDHFEREARGIVEDGYRGDSPHLRLLETRAEEVIGAPFERADFLAKLDRHFVDTLGKQRKYSGNRLLDLLRAFRNKKHHYEDMPEDVKKRVGPLAGGYLSYWCNRFPRLLMACYEVVHEAGLQNNDRFKGYFAVGRP